MSDKFLLFMFLKVVPWRSRRWKWLSVRQRNPGVQQGHPALGLPLERRGWSHYSHIPGAPRSPESHIQDNGSPLSNAKGCRVRSSAIQHQKIKSFLQNGKTPFKPSD